MIFFFFFNDTATTEIYTLSLHDALPISREVSRDQGRRRMGRGLQRLCLDRPQLRRCTPAVRNSRSEEHTSELQSPCNLVCRLLLEKKIKIDSRQSSIVVSRSCGPAFSTD